MCAGQSAWPQWPERSATDITRKTVLILGRTGSGKSTLANVLVGAHLKEPPTGVFKEGELASSETAHTQEAAVTIGGVTYRVVDTIGIGDTVLTEEQVLMKLARTCHALRGGINQIIYASSGRFTPEEQKTFNLLCHVLLDEDAYKFITMVRTNAPYFQDPAMCQKDIEAIKAITEGAGITAHVRKVIHVDNPTPYCEGWTTTRQKSRCIMLAWLENCNTLYHPHSLKKIQTRVDKRVETVNTLEKRLMELQEDRAESRKQNEQLIKALKEQHAAEVKDITNALKLQAEENYQRALNEKKGHRELSILWGLFKWESSW